MKFTVARFVIVALGDARYEFQFGASVILDSSDRSEADSVGLPFQTDACSVKFYADVRRTTRHVHLECGFIVNLIISVQLFAKRIKGSICHKPKVNEQKYSAFGKIAWLPCQLFYRVSSSKKDPLPFTTQMVITLLDVFKEQLKNSSIHFRPSFMSSV